MTIDKAKLKALAEAATGFCDVELAPDVVLALLAEIDKAEIRLHDVAVLCATVEQERDQLKTENDELRQDAERYRWLKVERRPAADIDAAFNTYGVPADEAIDAAMAKEASR